MQIILSQSARDVILQEFSFGISQFQENVKLVLENVSETEINFLSENINLEIGYGESLMRHSQELFDNFGFVVDAKLVYFFVSNIRSEIRSGINRLMRDYSANRIKRNLTNVFHLFLSNLKAIVDGEVLKIQYAERRDEDVLECWEIFKVPMLEIGYDAITILKNLAFSEVETLAKQFNLTREESSSKVNHLISDLSMRHLTSFSARLSVTTYVSFH